MKKTEKFKIIEGEIEMESPTETQDFVKGSAEYFSDFLLQFQKLLGVKGNVTAVCKERDWAFSLKMNRENSATSGAFVQGSDVRLSELVDD